MGRICFPSFFIGLPICLKLITCLQLLDLQFLRHIHFHFFALEKWKVKMIKTRGQTTIPDPSLILTIQEDLENIVSEQEYDQDLQKNSDIEKGYWLPPATAINEFYFIFKIWKRAPKMCRCLA